ncbi:MAG TPA: DUF2007 domain-containing protein [Firmicutes bacterium]|jgi:hypothetical protein|nr:DUF2007 domain-containing protein [Bacillota bacterium]
MTKEKLVVVGQYHNLVMADLAKARLDAAGIPSVLENESMAQVYPGASFAFGGVKLLVRAEDEQQALEILAVLVEDQPVEEDEEPDESEEDGEDFPGLLE